ncbi:MAG: DUF2062 domain-containing protein [Gemmatimonadota bacterium]
MRRVMASIVGQLRQGITAEKIALTIALGLVFGIFPILGATTVLCGIAAARLRLNQPLIQLVNYIAYPAQLLTLLPFYRAGETLLGRPQVPLSIPTLVERLRDDTGKFFSDFGMIAVGGIVVWCFVAPVFAGALYFGLRSPIRGLATRVRGTAPANA